MPTELPTLYFDCRYIRTDHHDGISRYSAELFKAISAIHPTVAVICDPKQLAVLPAGVEHVTINKPTSLMEPFAALKLNRHGAKLVFSPMQTIGSFGRKFRLIRTVHDLIYYKYPQPPADFSTLVKLIWRLYHSSYAPQRALLSRCDVVATVSQTTKASLNRAQMTERPIFVVANAADGPVSVPANLDNSASRDLIYMGSFMPYKNVETLIRGMEQLPEHTLHLLSRISEKRKDELLDYAGEATDQIVFHNGVSDEEYVQMLCGAQALVSASLEEGFGLPLIEAMSHGIPPVVANTKIFNEVAGSAGMFFDATQASAFVWQVSSLGNSEVWREASARSLEEAKQFSWAESAQSLLAAMKRACK